MYTLRELIFAGTNYCGTNFAIEAPQKIFFVELIFAIVPLQLQFAELIFAIDVF